MPTTKPKRLARGILSFAKIALLHCFPLCSFETQKLETPAPTIRSRWFHLPVFLTGRPFLLGAVMYWKKGILPLKELDFSHPSGAFKICTPGHDSNMNFSSTSVLVTKLIVVENCDYEASWLFSVMCWFCLFHHDMTFHCPIKPVEQNNVPKHHQEKCEFHYVFTAYSFWNFFVELILPVLLQIVYFYIGCTSGQLN